MFILCGWTSPKQISVFKVIISLLSVLFSPEAVWYCMERSISPTEDWKGMWSYLLWFPKCKSHGCMWTWYLWCKITLVPKRLYYIKQKVEHWKLKWRICLYVLNHFESETLILPIILNLLVPSVSTQQNTYCTIVASLINELCSLSLHSKSKWIKAFLLHPKNTPRHAKWINVSV